MYVYAYMYMYVCIIYQEGGIVLGDCPTQNGRVNCPGGKLSGGNCPTQYTQEMPLMVFLRRRIPPRNARKIISEAEECFGMSITV